MTFLQILIRTADHVAAYPPELPAEPGSLAFHKNEVYVVLDCREDYAYICRLRTPQRFSHQGRGTKALRWLCRAADKTQIELYLYALPQRSCPLSTERLRNWYMKAGFQQTDGALFIRMPLPRTLRPAL